MNKYLVITTFATRIYIADDWCDLINEQIWTDDNNILSISRLPDNCELLTEDIY